jgi:hypothetical protein
VSQRFDSDAHRGDGKRFVARESERCRHIDAIDAGYGRFVSLGVAYRRGVRFACWGLLRIVVLVVAGSSPVGHPLFRSKLVRSEK